MSAVYRVYFTKQATADLENLKAAHLSDKAKKLAQLVSENPYQTPPTYEKLKGDLSGMYSRRINAKHRFVYMVDEQAQTVKVLSMWSHYEKI